MNECDYVNGLMALIDSGELDARDVLDTILNNYLSKDDAEDFVMSEYGDMFDEYSDEDPNEVCYDNDENDNF